LPPFMTSTLQQAASSRLGFAAKKTMFLAQKLYEEGYITYMRTDSLNISKEALQAAGSWINSSFGPQYHEHKVFKSKSRLAQEAHEAIRPTNPSAEPGKIKLGKDEEKLYELIWNRFIASQMAPAKLLNTSIDITAGKHTLRANGSILVFDGFLKVWPSELEERYLPELTKGDRLELLKIDNTVHATEPPPRYNEASLIKTLEENGIGRPSTYAPIISVIQERNYVEKIQGRFQPTEIGVKVSKLLAEHFHEIVDIQFTAKMEEELDEIAEGKRSWQEVIKEFYTPFAKNLEEKYESVSKETVAEETKEICEKCGKPMVIKFGRFGKFLACSGFPECKNAKPLKEPPKLTGITCPKCGQGELVEKKVQKRGRARGKTFWGCNRYPDCDYAVWQDPTKEKAPAK